MMIASSGSSLSYDFKLSAFHAEEFSWQECYFNDRLEAAVEKLYRKELDDLKTLLNDKPIRVEVCFYERIPEKFTIEARIATFSEKIFLLSESSLRPKSR